MTASTRPLGITLVALSALAYSTAGFFTRLIPLDPQTILLYRGIVAGLFIAAFCVVMEGRNALRATTAIGRPGLLAALCSALATILFINAFRLTSVADVVILFATAPFVTAAISRVVYGVRESRATLIASAVALGGVAIMMGGAGSGRHLLGDLMAIGMTLLMSIMIVIVRQYRQTSMLPAASLSAFLCAALVLPAAAPFLPTQHELLLLVLFGTTQFGLGLILLTLGSRMVTATESALINSLEVPFAALWVWLAFSEVPAATTIIGGTIVFGAVLAHVLIPQRSYSSDHELPAVRSAVLDRAARQLPRCRTPS